MTGRASSVAGANDQQSQRIDKWLWFARFVKTRTLGTRLVTTGKIRLNRVKIDKPAQAVKIGDVITARIGRRIMVIKVVDTGIRRGPAAEAARLYEDLTPADPGFRKVSGPGQKSFKKTPLSAGKVGARLPGSGRPTKRERRQLNKLRENEN